MTLSQKLKHKLWLCICSNSTERNETIQSTLPLPPLFRPIPLGLALPATQAPSISPSQAFPWGWKRIRLLACFDTSSHPLVHQAPSSRQGTALGSQRSTDPRGQLCRTTQCEGHSHDFMSEPVLGQSSMLPLSMPPRSTTAATEAQAWTVHKASLVRHL